MVDDAERVARQAYAGFAAGDTAAVLSLVAEDLEWTFLDPSVPDPEPAVCRGRDQLAYWMGRGSGWKLPAELEEVVANGERVLVVTRSPGIDAIRARQTGDFNFHVLTVRDGKIVALRACRDRDEALGLVAAAAPGPGDLAVAVLLREPRSVTRPTSDGSQGPTTGAPLAATVTYADRSGPGNDTSNPGSWWRTPAHRAWLLGQAVRLLDFFRASVDKTGHFVELDDNGRRLHVRGAAAASQSLLTVARSVHSYALGELLGVPGCGPIVDQGLSTLWTDHRDTEAGGYLDTVAPTGATGSTKSAYGHAFVLLASSSALMAGHDARSLYADVRTVIDEHFWSEEDGAARESFSANWTELEAYRGANANMHLCEAFLAAADATGDRELVERAARIQRLLIDGHARQHGWMLPEHYDPAWNPELAYNYDRLDDPFRPYGVTIGHLLEWSRLLGSTWVATEGGEEWVRHAAGELFQRAVDVGWDDEHGGLSYTVEFDGSPANPDHYWWPVAEGIGASVFLAQLTGDASYEVWYRKFWDFAGAHLIDHARGGWYPELDPTNRRKVDPWHGKPDLYHALQSCLLPLLAPSPSLAGALRSAPPAL